MQQALHNIGFAAMRLFQRKAYLKTSFKKPLRGITFRLIQQIKQI